ncbi:Exodeoxyribonuclease VII small subunit [Proteiniborus ethanoligenes]|uniref:Exodeoxyribonuclease 7 small subunit n=1 Tax=Proteiniborus ethanoligenes TaxID=415015 RepID=A0A1H3K9N7_9FIRM|nr:exodeoxyribonuclease VII small subunit [Proteiniborus ethanoligenes]TAH63411.1 MAG: exodeoxyribonuclease VII small subunit [Gottschalkiaceae bacterium]SDY48505.1 Exodeoxyribonuclease VII small subunit [Proteiniborus ethanoligenes]
MAKKKQKLSYEEAILELESIVSLLENGELSLEESLTEFKKGVELYKHCYDILNNIEGEVKIILDNGNDNIEEMDFNVNS